MSEVQQFYAGQNVFITGGTGFLGKILIEKLLRSCSQISKIYILVRPRREKSIQERLNEMTAKPIFDLLRSINPDFEKKIIPLNGDASKSGLGLSAEDRSLIITEVSIIFHGAATTRFDAPLKVCVPINVNSVTELIDICRECTKLKAAVYLSTAFSQCVNSYIEEKVYPASMTEEEINNTLQIMKRRNLSEEGDSQFTKILLGNVPNTYVFTKSIAEELLVEKAKDLPFCVFRVPIVISTYQEPVPGWVDTVQGFNQGMIGIGLGAIHALNVDMKANLHLVPADFTCNALIAVAWETGTINRNGKPDKLPVYNYAMGEKCPKWTAFQKCCYDCRDLHLSNRSFYYPFAIPTKSVKLFVSLNFFLHLIPALMADLILRVLGKKPVLHKMYKKGYKLLEFVRFFMLRNWTFETNRMQSLWNKLSKEDKELLPFDMSNLNWEEVMVEYWKGVLKYILKDDMSPEGRKRANRRARVLKTIHGTIQALFAILITWVIWKLFCGICC